ncbi:hypothetical protein [Butyrivibrio sp. WCD2001]|uniref:hypothetical protein n=1 Tax=Butyrivibrio sp. WCD2001 TaxID=1280681 RepID=UPI000478A4C6|nr:hypothetical protein [Butyrivibrio sp. WCD2001]
MKENLIAGTVTINARIVSFVADGYKFTMLNVDNESPITIKADDAGFTWGRTFDNRLIAIYIGKEITISVVRHIK